MLGIYFGSCNGNTESVAEKLHAHLASTSLPPTSILQADLGQLNACSHLLLGISTWHTGELQEDWEGRWHELGDVQWSGKKIALFGCGDQHGYTDTFQDAMGELYRYLYDKGAHIYGYTSTEGYRVSATSKAIVNGWWCGLAVDEDNQAELTDGRIAAWVAALRTDFFAGA